MRIFTVFLGNDEVSSCVGYFARIRLDKYSTGLHTGGDNSGEDVFYCMSIGETVSGPQGFGKERESPFVLPRYLLSCLHVPTVHVLHGMAQRYCVNIALITKQIKLRLFLTEYCTFFN